MSWKGKSVFITGCTGLVGSWLTETLLGAGANVIGLIRDFVPNSNFSFLKLHERITIVNGSLENYGLISRAISEYNPDVVFHLAAQPIVGTANKVPLPTFETNIRGSWHVLEACRVTDTPVIVASSDKAYGSHKKLPYKEDFALVAKHPYDVSKACADMLAQSYYETYGLQLAITRCGNIYGGGDLNFNRIVPDTIRALLLNKNPVIRSDGKFIRDYFYLKDTVSAYLTLAENLDRKQVAGQAFNFGTGKPTTVIEVVNKLISISGKHDLKPKILNKAKAEIYAQYLDINKAKKVLKFVPKYDLDAGLNETYSWYSKHAKLIGIL
jgi:CDP-glucose 4,6-dehydratase